MSARQIHFFVSEIEKFIIQCNLVIQVFQSTGVVGSSAFSSNGDKMKNYLSEIIRNLKSPVYFFLESGIFCHLPDFFIDIRIGPEICFKHTHPILPIVAEYSHAHQKRKTAEHRIYETRKKTQLPVNVLFTWALYKKHIFARRINAN